MCCHDKKNSTFFCPFGPNCSYCKERREVALSPTVALGSPWASDLSEDEPVDPKGTADTSMSTGTGTGDDWSIWDDNLDWLDQSALEELLGVTPDELGETSVPKPAEMPALAASVPVQPAQSLDVTEIDFRPQDIPTLLDYLKDKGYLTRDQIHGFLSLQSEAYLEMIGKLGNQHPKLFEFMEWVHDHYQLPEGLWEFGSYNVDWVEDLSDLLWYLLKTKGVSKRIEQLVESVKPGDQPSPAESWTTPTNPEDSRLQISLAVSLTHKMNHIFLNGYEFVIFIFHLSYLHT